MTVVKQELSSSSTKRGHQAIHTGTHFSPGPSGIGINCPPT